MFSETHSDSQWADRILASIRREESRPGRGLLKIFFGMAPGVGKTYAMLEAAIPALEAISDWTADAIHDTLIDLAAKLEVKNATLMWPVRIAAAGKLVTPGGAVEICHLLGKDETLRRLRLGLDKLN